MTLSDLIEQEIGAGAANERLISVTRLLAWRKRALILERQIHSLRHKFNELAKQ